MDNQGNATPFHDRKYERNSFLEQLLYIDVTDIRLALSRAAMLLAQELHADKVDVFLHDDAQQSLVAIGVSDTPMGRLQKQLGLDRLPLNNGGNTVRVYQTGTSYIQNNVKQDPYELPAIKNDLGVTSVIATPLVVGGQRRGVVQVDAAQGDYFTEKDLSFLESMVHWVSIIVDHAELAEKQRRQAMEEGRRLAAEELMTILAHDLRNYLTPLKLRIDHLNRRALREQRQQDVEGFQHIKATFQRLEGLIDDMMDTSRLSHGLFALSREITDLVRLVTLIVQPFQNIRSNIDVQIPQDTVVFVDTKRLNQAITNILANAVKYSPENSTIEIKAIPQYEDGLVEISIKDQGPGIAPEVLSSLFEPFSASSRSSGLGLGLFLAQQIIQAHGGILAVDESYQQGARFLIVLPLHQSKTPLETAK